MGKPKVMIATPCNRTFPLEYVSSLTATWQMLGGRYDFGMTYVDSPLIYSNRNTLFARAYQDKVDYMLCIDSDMDWDYGVIDKMVAFDKDVVTGVCLSRKPMVDNVHLPVVFIKVGDEYRSLSELPNEPFKVDACGLAFVLLKKNVIEKMTDAIPELGLPFDPLRGKEINARNVGSSGLVGEDISFSYRLKKAGFDIWCLPDVKIGHIVSYSLGKA